MAGRSTYPGMVKSSAWRRTEAHKASSYSCFRCGKPFRSPHEVYRHIDGVHGKGK
jgi:uncharacterized C2H2 Zn-finger protein